MGESGRPILRVLALHTGGVAPLDARGTLGPRAGPLLRWMSGGAPLALGPGLEPWLVGAGAGNLPDGRELSAWWLQREGEGPSPTGHSADLMVAAAVLLRRGRAGLEVDLPRAGEPEQGRPRWWLTGSAALGAAEGDVGAPRLEPVQGWTAKIQHLAAALPALDPDRVVLLYAATQHDEVIAALQQSGAPRVEAVPIASPDELPGLLLRLFGPAAPQGEVWRGLFPATGPAAAAALTRAEALARQDGLGFLGVDHVMRALLESGERGPMYAQLRRLLPERELASVLVPPSTPPTGLSPTPRLRWLARALAPGFEVLDLLRAIVEDPTSPLHLVAGLDLALTLPQRDATDPGRTREPWLPRERAPATWLEVLRGPEDGRALRPRQGDLIGRAGGSAQLELYLGTPCHDRGLSRAHAIWRGDSRIEPLKPCRYVPGFAPRPAPAGEPLTLRDGEVIQLTPFTWLRGRT